MGTSASKAVYSSRLVQPASPSVLLGPDDMAQAGRLAIASGVEDITLMRNAGYAVAREVEKHWTKRPVLVICGPGNNGGDGYVVARYLQAAGWPVSVASLCEPSDLKGIVAEAATLWKNDQLPLEPESLDGIKLVVDAVFGAGLNRDFDGDALNVLKEASERGLPIVSIDVPSGLDGASGQVRGDVVPAELTVTFFRMKPGHKLLPGRSLCGALVLADIGIPSEVCFEIGAQCWVNSPALWRLPVLSYESHKYIRGHALIVGGVMTGASRLAVRAARRVGAGLATVLCSPESFNVYASDAPGTIVSPLDAFDLRGFSDSLMDDRKNVILIGPGHGLQNGLDEVLRFRVLEILKTGRNCILDADAIAAFADHPEQLFKAINGPVILTPHAGEFAKLFPTLTSDRLTNVREASKQSGATIVLKGSDTVIASPDGKAIINDNAPPTLATAGSGDVLSGLIAGLLAQGMRPLAAAAAGVWIHGDSARRFGLGLIAEDLPEKVPEVLSGLVESMTVK